MSIDVRLLTPADLAVLSHVAEDVFDDPINKRSAKAFLEDPHHMLVVAILRDAQPLHPEGERSERLEGRRDWAPQDEAGKGLVVGFASGVKTLHPDKEIPELFINELGVAPQYQRRGIATAIMKTLFAEAKKARCRIGWVPVDVDNDVALAFYKAIGGKPPERQIHIDFDLG